MTTDDRMTDTDDDVRPGPGWCDHDNEDHAYTLVPCTREKHPVPPVRA